MAGVSDEVRAQLAPTGTLRAGINLGNILLVTGETARGEPDGVSPGIARALAERLGVPVKLVPLASPGAVADSIGREVDVGLIAIEPARAETIAFSPPYVEIEATYLVPSGSPLRRIEDVDREGVRIAVSDRSAYDLYLTRTLKKAELRRAKGLAGALKLFEDEGLDALAGLRPALIENAEGLPGARVLEGCYTTVQQAIGTAPGNAAGGEFLKAFVAEAIEKNMVARLIERHGVKGRLQVAATP